MGTLKLKKSVELVEKVPIEKPKGMRTHALFWILWREDTKTVTQKCMTYDEVHSAGEVMQAKFPEATFWIMQMKKKVRKPIALACESEQNENASTTSQ